MNESTEPFITGNLVQATQFNNQLILLSGSGSNLPCQLDFNLSTKVYKWNGEEEAEFIEDEIFQTETLV